MMIALKIEPFFEKIMQSSVFVSVVNVLLYICVLSFWKREKERDILFGNYYSLRVSKVKF